MNTTISLPTIAFLIIFGSMFGMIIYLCIKIIGLKLKMSIGDRVDDCYPILLKEMPVDNDFYLEMCRKEEMQLADLN